MMNEYEYDKAPQVTNAGVTVKKSSIKRTENSGMKSSSHKRVQETPSKSHQPIVDAASPFKKKKESATKEVKIK